MKIFYLPDLGEGLAEAEVREWYVKEGDVVAVDQPLVSMETAKAVVDVPSPYAGKIVKLHGKANDIIPTGAAFVSFDSEGDEPSRPKNSVVGALEESADKWQEEAVSVSGAKTNTVAVKAMPAARVLAKELHVDLQQVKGTGRDGLITPQDVKAFYAGGTIAADEKMEALHGVRRHMAQAMVMAHREIVPVTIIEDADLTHVDKAQDLTVLVIQAMVGAVQKEPALNAWFDGKALARRLFTEVNIGMAVDSAEGLLVPVLRDCGEKSSKALRELIDQYKKSVAERKVAGAEMQGATIMLSNFGSIAGKYATPIIVPPCVAILGCGRTRVQAIVKEGNVMVGKVMPLSLTFDHRAVTGGEATRFLRAVIEHLEK